MSDNLDEKLENLLRSRRVEPASPDLAQRIILMAQQLTQQKTAPFWQSLRELFTEFHLPQPAYVLAGALLIGLVIGFSAPEDQYGSDDSGPYLQTFLSADEALL
ncbi:MAG TPA: hypothetical protein VHM64_15205 [Candidatus Binatia bacterium]|nr:hypothetical protein [Candidatus Binatia bacterium]